MDSAATSSQISLSSAPITGVGCLNFFNSSNIYANKADGQIKYDNGNGDMIFTAGYGIECMRITGNGGSLGIGTNAPATKLHVAGDATITGSTAITGTLTVGGTVVSAPVAKTFCFVKLNTGANLVIVNGALQFNTVLANTFASYSTSSYQLLVPTAGYVEVNLGITCSTASAGDLSFYVGVNNQIQGQQGPNIMYMSRLAANGGGIFKTAQAVVSCNAGDLLCVRSSLAGSLVTTDAYVYYKQL